MRWLLDDWRARRRLLRRHQAVRIVGLTLLATAAVWLVQGEGQDLLWGVLLMAIGSAIAWASLRWLARLETTRDPGTLRAVRFLVLGQGLKLMAIPVVALGGGWLAWGGGPGFAAELAVAGLGVAAYAYGVAARVDGLSMLPRGANYA